MRSCRGRDSSTVMPGVETAVRLCRGRQRYAHAGGGERPQCTHAAGETVVRSCGEGDCGTLVQGIPGGERPQNVRAGGEITMRPCRGKDCNTLVPGGDTAVRSCSGERLQYVQMGRDPGMLKQGGETAVRLHRVGRLWYTRAEVRGGDALPSHTGTPRCREKEQAGAHGRPPEARACLRKGSCTQTVRTMCPQRA